MFVCHLTYIYIACSIFYPRQQHFVRLSYSYQVVSLLSLIQPSILLAILDVIFVLCLFFST